MEKDQIQYLVDAANDVHRILSETVEPSEDDFRRVFAVACNTLQRAVAQADILEDLRKLAIRQEQFWTEYTEITANVDHFVHGFCNIERELLINAGINETTAQTLIQEATSLRKHIKNLKIEPEEVRQNLRKLRNEACEIARRLQNLPKERKEGLERKKKLKKFFYGISGAAIVAADASALALSLGMSLAGTAVSGGLGSGLIGAALAFE